MHLTSLPGPYGIGEIGRHARAFIDRLLDMTRTVVNIFSDSCGAVVIGKSEGEDGILQPKPAGASD